MAILDFQEIAQPGTSAGNQDSFELFARDTLDVLGFEIVSGPARGADLGKDLIAVETRGGLIGDSKVRWLVSCKHFAFSGRSVSPDDERNVVERVSAANCSGFLGFYSTLPSAGLNELLKRQSGIEIKFFDHEEIERRLLSFPKGRELVARYFPNSSKKLQHTPAELFAEPEQIECEYCGKDLLSPPSGIWVLWSAAGREVPEHYMDMHFACKGDCDRIVQDRVRALHASTGFIIDGWDDIPEMIIPTVYIAKIMAILNGFARGDRFEPRAFDKLKQLLVATFPFVSRHLSDKDRTELERLQQIPSWLGGMGFD